MLRAPDEALETTSVQATRGRTTDPGSPPMARSRLRSAGRRFALTPMLAAALWLCPSTQGPSTQAFSAAELGRSVTITRLEGKLRVEIGGRLFTEYVHEGQRKPILYPVHGPGDLPMTRNFPMKTGVPGEANDHPHHRSLWYTHGSVNGVDFWAEGKGSGTIEHEELLEARSGDHSGVIETRNRWVTEDGRIVLRDTRRLTFFEKDGARCIDFDISFHASEGDVVFGDTKEGSLGIRTHSAIQIKNDPGRGVTGAKGKAIDSEGRRDAELWGKRSKWVDYWGPIDGEVVGVAILDHPGNPMHPTWWHARDYGLVAANPFGVHDFERKAPGTGDMKIPHGESRTFRYRFIFHPGDAEVAGIAARWDEYARTHRSSIAGKSSESGPDAALEGGSR
jgi:hypothetical protein